MSKLKAKQWMWIIPLCTGGCIQAQTLQVISSAGQEVMGSNFQMSYTVGEMAVTTLSSPGHLLTQGYQQSNLFATAIEEMSDTPYMTLVYPNPVIDEITVEIKGPNQDVLIRLYDIAGKLINTHATVNEKSVIDFGNYSAGQYLLQIAGTDGKIFSSHRITKTN